MKSCGSKSNTETGISKSTTSFEKSMVWLCQPQLPGQGIICICQPKSSDPAGTAHLLCSPLNSTGKVARQCPAPRGEAKEGRTTPTQCYKPGRLAWFSTNRNLCPDPLSVVSSMPLVHSGASEPERGPGQTLSPEKFIIWSYRNPLCWADNICNDWSLLNYISIFCPILPLLPQYTESWILVPKNSMEKVRSVKCSTFFEGNLDVTWKVMKKPHFSCQHLP